MPRTLRFGIQGGPIDTPYAELRDYWREAEHLGYDWASIGDHLMPNPIFGAKGTDPWHEAWTTIAALAEATSTIHIGTAVGFRHPAILAKMAATLDVISGGRLEVGLGAGYLESEYRMYGLPFPGVRLAELNEAIQICKPLTQEHTDFNGKYFTLTNAVCSPKPAQRPHPPIWLGGGGEQKTLRMVAEHADGWSAFPLPIPQLQHKLDVLRAHCADVGRDYDTIAKQIGLNLIIRNDEATLEAELARFAAERQAPPERARQMVSGFYTPRQVAAQITPYLNLGFDLFVLMGRTPADYDTLRLFIQEVAPILRTAQTRAA
ncbi:MAG: TIGR03560 family F420-dependent LLM class oxidoreductase [Chloroflexia bacterium]